MCCFGDLSWAVLEQDTVNAFGFCDERLGFCNNSAAKKSSQ
jgi:hypothetical protein